MPPIWGPNLWYFLRGWDPKITVCFGWCGNSVNDPLSSTPLWRSEIFFVSGGRDLSFRPANEQISFEI